MKRNIRSIFITTLIAAWPFIGSIQTAHAQSVELVTKAEKEVEVDDKGKKSKQLVAPSKMVPGDEVVYTITYHNKTAKPAEKVVITNPVPQHTKFKDGSASGDGADIAYSADGGKTFATPDKLRVAIKDKSGKDVERAAAAGDYTHVRWTLRDNVAPGRQGSVRFRAVIQ